MSEQYIFSTGLDYTVKQLTEMHNESFIGYFVPMNMTAVQTANFNRTQQLAVDQCVVMHSATNEFVGMAKLARRGTRVYCAGFGIVPAFRQRGAGKILAKGMVDMARRAVASSLQLEVLVQNTAAYKLYVGAGLQTVRELVGLQIEAVHIPTIDITKRNRNIEHVESMKLVPYLARNERPAWGRELATILASTSKGVVCCNEAGEKTGVVYNSDGERIFIYDVVLSERSSVEDIAVLLREIVKEEKIVQLYNEPEGSRLFGLCQEVGFVEFFRQYEMSMNL